MLYVNDVEMIADFLIQVGFIEISRENIMDTVTIVIAPCANSDARIQLFNHTFIKQMSPEVADNKPSLLFLVNNIDDYYNNVKDIAPRTSELVDMGGKRTFNFSDVEDNAYAFMEGA